MSFSRAGTDEPGGRNLELDVGEGLHHKDLQRELQHPPRGLLHQCRSYTTQKSGVSNSVSPYLSKAHSIVRDDLLTGPFAILCPQVLINLTDLTYDSTVASNVRAYFYRLLVVATALDKL